MSTSTAAKCPFTGTTALKKGDYAPSTSTDLRGPCPLVNCLANHGYIPRDGRNVRAAELYAAMSDIGLSNALGAGFAHPIFLERNPPPTPTLLGRLWYLLRNPWAIIFANFGMRKSGQFDNQGKAVLNLDQLGLPGVVEHDISLTRRDHQQGDNISIQPDLLRDLLASSSDGQTITMEDFAKLRQRRIARQTEDNPSRVYGEQAHTVACTEIALVLGAIGDGQKVRCDYAKAFFQEERLPVLEGWKRRPWYNRLGLVELFKTVGKIKELVGIKVTE